jgi:hypothetical protein
MSAPVVPGIPAVVGTPTSESITVQFDAGTNVDNFFNQYFVRYGPGVRAAPPAPPGTVVQTDLLDPRRFSWFPATLFTGTQFRATITGLPADTTYFFESLVQYRGLSAKSALSEPITTGSPGPVGPSPPSGPPSVPEIIAPPTETAARLYFTTAGVTGNPTPSFKLQYSTSSTGPWTDAVATRANPVLALYVSDLTGLTASTPYFARSVAFNTEGTENSANMTFTTDGGGGTAPSGPPTVPAFISATTATIVVSFDTAGITGVPDPTYSVVYDTSPTGPFTASAAATLSAGTVYRATVGGLAPNTTYYFKSVAANGTPPDALSAASTGYATLPGPPPPPGPELRSLYVINFLLYDGTQWVISQQNSPDIGQWFLTGPNAGTIINNTGQSVIPYLTGLQAKGCKIILSMGGGGLTSANLTPMLSNIANTAASVVYALLTTGTGTNPLNFAKTGTPWANFAFDGFDLDIEGPVGYQWPDGSVQWQLANAIRLALPGTILTAAPQAPNLVSQNAFGGNGNGAWYPFPHVYPSDTLANYNTNPPTGGVRAWMYPPDMRSSGLNYIFVQFYNQGPSWYPGTPNTSFNVALAMWGWLCVLAQTAPGVGPKIIVGFATFDGQPIWDQGSVAPALNTAITAANALITAQPGYSAIVPSHWLAGIGFWNSPSANSVAATIYSPAGALPNLPAEAVQLYQANSQPCPNPGWSGPVPNTRG